MDVPNRRKQRDDEELITYDMAEHQYKVELLPSYSQMTILGKRDVDIEESFIPIGVVMENDDEDEPIRTNQDIILEIRRVGGKILIKGMPGTGKTTLMRKLMHDFCTENSEIFPIYLKASIFQEIGEFEEKKLVDIFSRFVEAQVEDKKYSDVLLANYFFRKRTTCVLIDGID